MTASNILLANNQRIATDERTVAGKQVHDQSVVIQGSAVAALGVEPEESLFSAFVNKANSSDEEMGDSVGSVGTPVVFHCLVPADKIILLSRVNFVLADGGTVSFSEFGSIAELTNGLIVRVLDDDGTTELIRFTNNNPIKRNGDFGSLAGTDVAFYNGTGDDGVISRWTLTKALGKPLLLTAGQSIEIIIQDDISNVSSFRATGQGQILDA